MRMVGAVGSLVSVCATTRQLMLELKSKAMASGVSLVRSVSVRQSAAAARSVGVW